MSHLDALRHGNSFGPPLSCVRNHAKGVLERKQARLARLHRLVDKTTQRDLAEQAEQIGACLAVATVLVPTKDDSARHQLGIVWFDRVEDPLDDASADFPEQARQLALEAKRRDRRDGPSTSFMRPSGLRPSPRPSSAWAAKRRRGRKRCVG